MSAASKPPVLPCLARFVKAESYDGHSGVNFNSVLNYCLFNGENVALELEAVDSTRLRGGMRCRFCVSGPGGQLCSKVVVNFDYRNASLKELFL